MCHLQSAAPPVSASSCHLCLTLLREVIRSPPSICFHLSPFQPLLSLLSLLCSNCLLKFIFSNHKLKKSYRKINSEQTQINKRRNKMIPPYLPSLLPLKKSGWFLCHLLSEHLEPPCQTVPSGSDHSQRNITNCGQPILTLISYCIRWNTET